MDIKLSIGERMKDLRVNRHKTLEQVMNESGVDKNFIQRMEDDRIPGQYERLVTLADYYGVTVDYLLGRSDSPTVERDKQIAEKTTGLSHAAFNRLMEGASPVYVKTANSFFLSGLFGRLLSMGGHQREKNMGLIRKVLEEELSEEQLREILYDARHRSRDMQEDIKSQVDGFLQFDSLRSAAEKKLEGFKSEE